VADSAVAGEHLLPVGGIGVLHWNFFDFDVGFSGLNGEKHDREHQSECQKNQCSCSHKLTPLEQNTYGRIVPGGSACPGKSPGLRTRPGGRTLR
jgi:hypothetical protein